MSLTLEQKSDVVAEVTKAAPPVTVAGATIAGMQVNDMILWATLLYLVLQIAFLLYRWGRLHFMGKTD
jgi:Phage holin T7 family, holin superfamily II